MTCALRFHSAPPPRCVLPKQTRGQRTHGHEQDRILPMEEPRGFWARVFWWGA